MNLVCRCDNMKKPKLTSIKSYDGGIYFRVKPENDIHRNFIGLLNDLNFPKDNMLDIDVCFTEVDQYFHFEHGGYSIHIIISEQHVHTIVEYKQKKEMIMNIIGHHFDL